LESKKISAKELLKAIPDELLVRLSYFTDVDYQVKKLYGRNVFYLLLFGLLESTRVSLRSLEDIYNSRKFRYIFNLCHSQDAKYNSISDRLKTMEVAYFEEIYKSIFSIFSDLYSNEEAIKYKIVRVDSTMIAEAANKLEKGMRTGGKTNKKQIKYTINLNELFPSSIAIYTEQQCLSEDLTIPRAIMQSIDRAQDNVFVFDQGVRSRAKFIELDQNNYRFVTRLSTNALHEVIKVNPVKKGVCVGNLQVNSDEIVLLYNRKNGKVEHPFRLLKTRNNKKELWFLSNQFDLSVEEIIKIYRKRWDIEVFFRFLKQEMNITHLISTNLNGIKIVLYMTLIAAMLILVYKRLNDIGYKTAKRRFTMELDDMISIILIKLCGGDPSLVFR
jgi:transposase